MTFLRQPSTRWHTEKCGDSPVAVPTARSWLRKASIEGGASFFGGTASGQPRSTEIPLSPGLICIIGASMAGKSTLLDGLRLHVHAELPPDPALRLIVIILVTHNANIVVNGDADFVVQLEAEANRGRVAMAGAMEDADVRRAVVDTVDGGRDAFEPRKVKYGF